MVRIQVWDTAGQEKFHCLIPQYIQDSSVAVIVYDITGKFLKPNTDWLLVRSSFEHVQKWVEDARNYRGNDIMIVLVGNKLDDEEKRQVTTDEGASLARQLAVGDQEV